MPRLAIAAAGLCLAAGCATIPDEEKALLTGEIDCARAEETIEAIRRARPTDIDRARTLALALTPIGIAVGVATRDLRDRERLMSGAYDDELNARIRAVATACGLPAPELDDPATPPVEAT